MLRVSMKAGGLRKTCWYLSLVAVTAFIGTAVADEGKIIAVYGDAVKKVPPPGWSFLWNANGEIGTAKNYAPLSYYEKQNTYGVLDEAGNLIQRAPRSSGVAKGTDGSARFYVASFTIPEDSQGEVWLNNGNIQHRYGAGDDGLLLHVYLNDELKAAHPVKRDRLPLLFQEKLGQLKKGDIIYVAVGPGEKNDWGLFALQFTIMELPAGNRPADPVNIISPPITASEPRRTPDGGYVKWYVDSQKRQDAAALKDMPQLVFLGDSITAGWKPKVLNEKLAKYKPAVQGISGDWIQNVRWRVESGVLDQVKPKVVVVLIGTNNLANGFTVGEIVEGTGLLIETLREKTPSSKILLLGIFPRGKSIKDPVCENIRQINAKTALLADDKSVFFLDIGDKLVEPDGTISAEVMPDGLHLGEPGYVRWADAILPTLDKLFDSKER